MTARNGGPVVAFRTHLWNDDIARFARRARHFSQGARFVVLMDETRGPIAAENFTKLAHGSDFSSFGLPTHPVERMLWYNADYPLYQLRRAYPDATHYAMIEYDVAVNADIMPMLQTAQDEAIDMIAAHLRESDPSWFWHDTVVGNYARPLRAFIPLLVVSGRAIDKMLEERRRLTAVNAISPASPKSAWPFCEAFIPSAAALLEKASLRNLSDFFELPYFDTRPEQHADDPAMMVPGTMSHPVAGGDVFIARRFRDVRYEDIFEPGGWLLRQLSFCDPAKFAEPLFNAVKRERDMAKVKAFLALAEERRWPVKSPFQNLAFFKPALMSSAWAAGPSPDLARLAGGGNNGAITGGFGFHTDIEDQPWWQVDLCVNALITHIVVYNRLDEAARCRKLRASGSLDGKTWHVLAEKRDDALFGGADGRALVIEIQARIVARYIRVTNMERNFLHLDDVQVYGKEQA